jgi:hypothetical protein
MAGKNLKNNVVYTIVGVLLLIIIVIALGEATLTGNASRRDACSDSDPEQNELIRGNVTMQHRTGANVYWDDCPTPRDVRQYKCADAGTRIGVVTAFCTNGCSNGVCK